jgi:hypothetical protein
MAAGLIREDATLFTNFKGRRREATVDAEGRLHLDDGTVHSSPSSAARSVARHSVNGWTFWRVQREGEAVPLGALRDEASANLPASDSS